MGALAGSPAGKVPEPDGFTTPYYKAFHEQLPPHFTSAFNTILDSHAIPPDLSASILVIPKPGKDSLLCANYKPISLLNCNLKLFTIILAERLGTILQCIIPLDQVSFIHNREARHNTIRIINDIARGKHPS